MDSTYSNAAYSPNKEALLTMAKHLNIHPIFLYHLHLHGYEQFETIERFLVPNWEHCHSPFLLQDMKRQYIEFSQQFVTKKTS